MFEWIKKRILHDILKWGFRYREGGFDAIGFDIDRFQPTYLCRFCEYEITQDSTGSWFHLKDYNN